MLNELNNSLILMGMGVFFYPK